MRVLVTGGSGFIGRYVCSALRTSGHQPVVFERKTTRPNAEVMLGDVRDYTAVNMAVGETDAVIHLAGVLGTAETVDDPKPAMETNILGALNVFQCLRFYDKPGVYITLGNYWMNNPYSISKSTSERLALMFNKEHGTRIAVVRAMNAYGPGQKTAPVRKIMPTLINKALNDEALTIYGDGEQVMDQIYVTDVAQVLVRALLIDHGMYDSVAFEAASGYPSTVNEIAETIIARVGKGRIEHVPMRPGEEPGATVLGDPATLKPLDIFPEELVSLRDGIDKTVEYYQSIRS